MPKDSDNVQAQAEPSSLDLLNTVSVKVPAFWLESSEAWFIQVEAQFALKGVSSSSMKFYYCVSAFNQDTANQVLDLIKSPPTAGPYKALKNRLLKLFALDDYQRYEAISNLPLSGDMKPSKLMSNMLALLPAGHKPCFFLKGAFLKRLPADIRAHLIRDDFSDPITKIPDRFWCIGISVPCSKLFFHLVRSQVAYSRWFLTHMLWFSDYTSSIWRPQV